LKTLLLVLIIGAQVSFGVALFYTCFCRLAKTTGHTRREVRWAIILEAAAGGLVAGAPLLPFLVPELNGHGLFKWRPWKTPMWIWLALLVAATLMQFATARFWRGGVPRDFQST
jgi:hypothetical protein